MQSEGYSARRWTVPVLVAIVAFIVLLVPSLVASWLVPPTERMVTLIDLRNRTGTIDTTDLENALAAGGSGPSTLLVLVSPDSVGVPACSRPEAASLCGLRQTYPQAAFVASDLGPQQLLVASGVDPNGIAVTRGVFHAAIAESTGGRTAVAVVVAAVLALACYAIFALGSFRPGGGPQHRAVRVPNPAASRVRHTARPATPEAPTPTQRPGSAHGWSGGPGAPGPEPRRLPPVDQGVPRRSNPPGDVPRRAGTSGAIPVHEEEPPRPVPPRTEAPPRITPPAFPAPLARTFIDSDGGYVEDDGIVVWAVLAPTEATPIEPDEPVAIVGGAAGEPLLIAKPRRPSVTTDAERKP